METLRSSGGRRAAARLATIAFAAAALGAVATAAAPPTYRVDYLAPFGVPLAQNSQGHVVGWNPVFREAFVHDGTYRALPCPAGYTVCRAADINDSGWIVGRAERNGLLAFTRALLWIPAGGPGLAAEGYRVLDLGIPPGSGDTSSEAVAINRYDQVVGHSWRDGLPASRLQPFLWTELGGAKRLDLPGRVVDLTDTGLVAGNGETPYLFDLDSGRLSMTRVPGPYRTAAARAASHDGTLVGSLHGADGSSYFAATDARGVWEPLGGVGDGERATAINDAGDMVGHAHGLDLPSHCAVRFVEERELRAVEGYLHPAARTWRLEEVGGVGDDRSLAMSALQTVTGLPALVRLVPSETDGLCAANCLRVERLALAPKPGAEGGTLDFEAKVLLGVARGPAATRPSPTIVEAVWVLDGGARVVRENAIAVDGVATFTQSGNRDWTEFYVTSAVRKGYTFDPTRGMLATVYDPARPVP